MISKIAFTGREAMLTDKLVKPLEQQVVKASTYIEEKLAPKAAEVTRNVASNYTIPCAPIGNIVENASVKINRNGLNFFA